MSSVKVVKVKENEILQLLKALRKYKEKSLANPSGLENLKEGQAVVVINTTLAYLAEIKLKEINYGSNKRYYNKVFHIKEAVTTLKGHPIEISDTSTMYGNMDCYLVDKEVDEFVSKYCPSLREELKKRALKNEIDDWLG